MKDSFQILQERIIAFREARGWDKVVPQDYAKSIIIEAAELLEHFQWDGTDKNAIDSKNTEDIASEIADVFAYLIMLSHDLQLDLIQITNKKYDHNEIKYSAKEFNGKHNEEYYREQRKKYKNS